MLKLLGAIGLAALIAIPFAAGCAAPEEAPAPAPTPPPAAEVITWKVQAATAAGETKGK